MRVRGQLVASAVSRATHDKHVEATEIGRLTSATVGHGDRTFVVDDTVLTGPVDADPHDFTEATRVPSTRVIVNAWLQVYQYNKRATLSLVGDTIDMENSGKVEFSKGLPADRTTNGTLRQVEIGVVKTGDDRVVIEHFSVI